MIALNSFACCDALIGLKDIPDNLIDMTITSPPYDGLRAYNGYSFDFENIAKEIYRVTKEGGVLVWIVADATIEGTETGTSFKQALYFKQIGFLLNDTMIWDKGTFRFPHKVRYRDSFEYMFVFTKGKPKSVNLIADRENKYADTLVHGTFRDVDGSVKRKSGHNKILIQKYGVRFNIWRISNVGKAGTKHPATFPEELVKDHILSWSKEGDLILDPFLGSGTTAIVCRKLNRNFIGFEISEEYIRDAERRIAPLNVNKKEDGFPPNNKLLGIQPTIL